MKKEEHYKEGKKVGLWVVWYKNGQIKKKGNYKDGRKVGLWISFVEDGQVKIEGNYKDGKKVGLWRMWYDQVENDKLVEGDDLTRVVPDKTLLGKVDEIFAERG